MSGRKKIAFVQNITEALLGYMHLSAYAKARGHTAAVFIDNLEKDILARVKEFDPDILGYYCVIGNLEWGTRFLREYKKHNPKCLTLLGGPHPTIFPQVACEEGVDAICIGESEETLADIGERYDGSVDSIRAIRNVFSADRGNLIRNPLRPLIENLDLLPAPDQDLYAKYRFITGLETFPVSASRGCPFSCSYCYNQTLRDTYKGLGNFVRMKSPQRLIAELTEIVRKYGRHKHFFFVDSILNANKAWLTDFLTVYREQVGRPFFCQIRADLATERQIDELADAGCRTIGFGIEGAYRLRKDVLKRDLKDGTIVAIAKKIRERKIILVTTNMFGLPTETLEETYELIRLNQRIGTDIPNSTVYQPYPGTDLDRFAREKGLLGDIDYNKIRTYFHHSLLNQKDIKIQERLQKLTVFFVRYPKLSFFWRFLALHAPFFLLYILFTLALTLNVKRIYRYSLLTMIRYGLLNFRIYSKR